MLLKSITVVLLLGFVSSSTAQYRDSYPKNNAIDMLGYVFNLTFSDESDSIHGTTTVTARYLEAGHRDLRLDLVQVSEESGGKGMRVTRIESDGEDLPFRHEDNQLFIDLGREVAADERIDVTVHYSGEPADGLVIGPNKHGDRTFFSDNWSSRVRHWLPVVDHPSDKATTEMIVVAPSRYQVASNGTVIETTDLGDGNRRTHYVNPVPTATWLYFVGVAQFAIQQVDTYEDVPIETWVYWQDRDKGFYDFAEPSKKVVAFFSDLVGPYVNRRLANIVSNATPGGGMEAASTPAYSDQSVTGERTQRWQHVIIHEIAHQWFGNAVTEFHWNDVWLSEGFATYYTLLFRQHLYGHDDFFDGLREARQAVVDFYEKDYDFQIVRDYVDDLNRVSGPMMYQKGAWVLHMLREQIGAEAYDAGIRSYYAEFMNRNAQTADLRRHLEKASGQPLEQFFAQWLFQGGIPELRGSWTYGDGRLVIRMEQVQETYQFHLAVDLRVEFSDGSSRTMTLPVAPEQLVLRTVSLDKSVTHVTVDPRTRLLAKWDFGRE